MNLIPYVFLGISSRDQIHVVPMLYLQKEKAPENQELISYVVTPPGLEPGTCGLEDRCSIQLSYEAEMGVMSECACDV